MVMGRSVQPVLVWHYDLINISVTKKLPDLGNTVQTPQIPEFASYHRRKHAENETGQGESVVICLQHELFVSKPLPPVPSGTRLSDAPEAYPHETRKI